MMGEEKPKTTIQQYLEAMREQQINIDKDVLFQFLNPSMKVSADVDSMKSHILPSIAQAEQDRLKCLMIEPSARPFVPTFIPFWDLNSPNPLKKFPDDGEIHINVKKRNIKFNFKN